MCPVALLIASINMNIAVVFVFMLAVIFFMLNTITLTAAAAEFPHRDQYIFIGSHVVFGYLIQTQTPRRTREKKPWLRLIHRFGFSCFLCNKDPWSFWAEPSALTHTEVVISAPGFDHNVNTYLSHLQREKVGRESDTGIRSRHFQQLIGRSTSLVWVSVNKVECLSGPQEVI